MLKRDWQLLFSEYDLMSVLDSQRDRIGKVAAAIPVEQLKNADLEQLLTEAAAQLHIEPLHLREDDITVGTEDAKVDVSHDFDRAIFDRSEPHYVDGIEVTYYLPFAGHPQLLECRPSTYTMNPPRAVIGDSELRFPYSRADRDAKATKPEFEKDLATLRQWVGWVNQQVQQFNSTLEGAVRQRISDRKQAVLQTETDISDLGFKVRPATRPPAPPEPPRAGPTALSSVDNRHGKRSVPEYEVALSFAGEDREYVHQVATTLRDEGISVFYDTFEEVELWGKNLADHFARVYSERSRFVVMFVSVYYAAKAWPNYERQQAQAKALAQQQEFILPVRFDDTEVPGLPSTVAYLDARRLAPAEIAARIRAKLGNSKRDA